MFPPFTQSDFFPAITTRFTTSDDENNDDSRLTFLESLSKESSAPAPLPTLVNRLQKMRIRESGHRRELRRFRSEAEFVRLRRVESRMRYRLEKIEDEKRALKRAILRVPVSRVILRFGKPGAA